MTTHLLSRWSLDTFFDSTIFNSSKEPNCKILEVICNLRKLADNGWSSLNACKLQRCRPRTRPSDFPCPSSQTQPATWVWSICHKIPQTLVYSQGDEEIDGTCLLLGLFSLLSGQVFIVQTDTWPPWTPCWQCFRVANALMLLMHWSYIQVQYCWETTTNNVWLPAMWMTPNCESQVAWTGRSMQTRRWYSWC